MSEILQKEDKRQIYEMRKQAKVLINTVQASLIRIAYDRKEFIREYVNITNRNKRGKFAGLCFDKETLQVQAHWDYYEGFYKIPFPQDLLWSNAELLKAKQAEQVEREFEERDKEQRERAMFRKLKNKFEKQA